MKNIDGNLLDRSPGILCHQVNTLGIMGAGLALQIKERWPKIFTEYRDYCRRKADVGNVLFVQAADGVWVANLFGQFAISMDRVMTDYSSYPAMLKCVRAMAEGRKLPVYIPTGIGCGIAGGDWSVLLPILEKHLPEATLITFQSQPNL